MPGSDDLSALIADLDALPSRQRNEIFGVLKQFERVQFEALMRQANAVPIVPGSPFSSWLRDRVDGSRDNHMTDATRLALREIANDLDESTIVEEAGSDSLATPPLIGAFGRLFAKGRR
jgi:hypothetical protein